MLINSMERILSQCVHILNQIVHFKYLSFLCQFYLIKAEKGGKNLRNTFPTHKTLQLNDFFSHFQNHIQKVSFATFKVMVVFTTPINGLYSF